MAVAGNIVVNLIARTEAFTKGIKASQRNLKALSKATAATIAKVQMIGTVAGTAAVAGLTLVTKKSMENIDALAKMSDRLGTSTEFLAAFGHQAQIAGMSSADFTKGIEMFVRRLGEVTQGTGEAKYGLEALKLTATELINMGPEKAFMKVADGIKSLSNQSEKAAVAYRFFGRSGSKMLNLLESDISNVIEEAEKLGITFSRANAAKVEQANDAITRMKAAWQGVGNTIAIAVAPFIEVIADRITGMVSGQSSISGMQKKMQSFAIAATYVSDGFLVIKGVVRGIIGLMQKMLALTMVIPAEIAKGFAKLADLTGMDELAEKIRGVSSVIDEVGQAMMDAGRQNMDLAKQDFMGIGKARADMKEMFKEMDNEPSINSPSIPTISTISDFAETKKKSERFLPSGREIDTSSVSVAGLSMGARNVSLSDVNETLERIERNTDIAARKESLN